MDYKSTTFALSKIGTALTAETDLNSLFRLIVDEVIQVAHCDGCSLYLKEDEPERLIFQSTRTLSLEEKQSGYVGTFKARPIKLEKTSIAGYTAITGDIVNIPDCYAIPAKEEYKFNTAYDQASGYKTVSMLSIPMKLQDGTVIGVIQLINNLDEKGSIIPFPRELEEVIIAVASQAAVAINNARLKAVQAESSFAFIILNLSLVAYSFFLVLFDPAFSENAYTITTLIFSFYFVIISLFIIRNSKLPVSKFGLSLKNLRQSLAESIAITGVVILLITLLKIWAVNNWPLFAGYAIIDFNEIGWPFYSYLLVAPIQEFITRGVLQSTVERIMPGKYNWLWAIIVSSCLFGAFHIFYSFNLAVLTIGSGFLWGFMYARHRNIIGISISHFAIGNYLVLTHFWYVLF